MLVALRELFGTKNISDQNSKERSKTVILNSSPCDVIKKMPETTLRTTTPQQHQQQKQQHTIKAPALVELCVATS